MPEIVSFLKREEIDSLVSDVAKRISSDCQGQELVLIGILKGAFIFLSDLIRKLTIPIEIDFIGASSYETGTSSSGKVRLTKEIEIDVENKDILIVEDIIDTGLTLSFLMDYLKSCGPKSLKVCTLLDKRERRIADVKIDYACRVLESGFLVGYGLDYAEKYRHLPEIFHLKL